MATEQENTQPEEAVGEPEPKEEVITVQDTNPKEELVQQIRTCVIDGDSCKGLGDKLRDTAKELDISIEELIDEVFDQLACQEG